MAHTKKLSVAVSHDGQARASVSDKGGSRGWNPGVNPGEGRVCFERCGVIKRVCGWWPHHGNGARTGEQGEFFLRVLLATEFMAFFLVFCHISSPLAPKHAR